MVPDPIVIFINDDLSDNIRQVFTRQFYLTEIISGADFDSRVVSDAYYVKTVHTNKQRILVVRSFADETNRDLADIVLSFKAGLVSVKKSKYGPPGLTIRLNEAYLYKLTSYGNTIT